MLAQALTVAGGLVITALTGGAGAAVTAELFAAQVARAALANAMMNVAIEAAVKGERLDVRGAEAAFLSGAVQGVAFSLAAVPANTLSRGYAAALTETAPGAATTGYRAVGPGLIKTVTEGGVGSSLVGGVETAAKADTWKNGFLDGIAKVRDEMFVQGLIGAGIGVVMHAAIELVKAQLFPGGGDAAGGSRVAPPDKVDGAAAQRNALGLLRSGSADWQHWIKVAEEMGEHRAGLPARDARRTPGARRRRRDRARAGAGARGLQVGAQGRRDHGGPPHARAHAQGGPGSAGARPRRRHPDADRQPGRPGPRRRAGARPRRPSRTSATTEEKVEVEVTADAGKGGKVMITEPVQGLYDKIDPRRPTPSGWEIDDSLDGSDADVARVKAGEAPQGDFRITTSVKDPNGKSGHVIRSYDPKTGQLVMEEAFLNGLKSKIPGEVGFGAPGAETPLLAYVTMRQMKLFNIGYGSVTKVKISTIHNVVTICEFHEYLSKGAEVPPNVARKSRRCSTPRRRSSRAGTRSCRSR